MCRVTPFNQLHKNVADHMAKLRGCPASPVLLLFLLLLFLRFFMCLCVLNVKGHRKIKDPEPPTSNSKKCDDLRYLPCAVWWDETFP